MLIVIQLVKNCGNWGYTALLPPYSPEFGGRTVLRKVGIQPLHYTSKQPRKKKFSTFCGNRSFINVFTRARHIPRCCVIFRNKLFSYAEKLLAPRPIPNLEDNPLFAVRKHLIQYIRNYPPHLDHCHLNPQPEDASYRGDKDHASWKSIICWLSIKVLNYVIPVGFSSRHRSQDLQIMLIIFRSMLHLK
jgi:hypothetical protein